MQIGGDDAREDAKARSYVIERPDSVPPSDLFSMSFKPVFSAIFASSRETIYNGLRRLPVGKASGELKDVLW